MNGVGITLLTASLPILLLAGCGGDAAAGGADVAYVGETPAAAESDYTSIEADEEAAVRKDVPYVATPQETVNEMLRMANVGRNDVLYDLGSGDGRIVITAAKRHGARGVGIDIDPERIREANENAQQAGVTDRVRFIQGDMFDADLREATAVTLYLLSSVNLRLRPKLLEELKPGTPVVSHDFNMGEWEADEYKRVGKDDVYLWIIPAQVADKTWRWTAPDGSSRAATFEQNFQKLSGNVSAAGATHSMRDGRLRGEEISFAVANGPSVERYTGRVSGDTIRGTVEVNGRRTRWRANV